jgi:hypothetical protein
MIHSEFDLVSRILFGYCQFSVLRKIGRGSSAFSPPFIAGSAFAGIQHDSFSVPIRVGTECFISDDHLSDSHEMKRLACGVVIFGDSMIPRKAEILFESCFISCTFLSTISFKSNSSLIKIESHTLSEDPDQLIVDNCLGRSGMKRPGKISIYVNRFGHLIYEPNVCRLSIRAGKQNPVWTSLVHL